MSKNKIFLPCHSSVKWSNPGDFLKAQFVIFRCQKYVKKGYIEMRKWIYLVPLKSVLGCSSLHYYLWMNEYSYMNIHDFLMWQLYFHIFSIADFLFTFFHSGYKCIGLKLWDFDQHLLVTLKLSIKQNNMG